MSRDVLVLDRTTSVAPLGLRFRDAATKAIVADGLVVTAYPERRPRCRVQAHSNRSGVYVLNNLPGLRELENGSGDADYWSSLPDPRPPFVVEVGDTLGRFLPFTFTARPPERGLFAPPEVPLESPMDAERSIPLFSAPSRPVPAGMAVVRAELWHRAPGEAVGRPAAWAVVEATIAPPSPGRPAVRARGVADERGRVSVVFPYPPPPAASISSPVSSPVGSPLEPTRVPLAGQTWSVSLNALYRPPSSLAVVPELRHLLELMPPGAHLFLDAAQTQPLPALKLRFGQELVAKPEDESILFVSPVGSPP